MRKPSILFINRIYPPYRGATGRVLKDLAKAFVAKGWDVTILTTGDRGKKYYEGPLKFIHTKAPMKPRSALSYAWVLFKLWLRGMRQPAHSIVASMTDPPLLAWIAGMIAKKQGAAHIHWAQDVYPDLLPVIGKEFPAPIHKFMEKRMRSALERCDKLIVIGRCMAQHFIKQGIPPGKITLLPNWPDKELYIPKDNKPRTLSPKIKPKSGKHKPPEEQLKSDPKFRVLYAGTIGLAHPIKPILEAAEILQLDYPEIEFVFVGGGKFFDWLAAQRSARNLNNIRLIPYQPASRLQDLMEGGDIHLVSMREDAKGLMVPSKFYSAIAVSRPCVYLGPEGSEGDLVLSEFGAGVRVDPDNAQALAEAIRDYRLDSDKWFAAHNAAAEAAKVFVPEDAMSAWVERAENILKKV